MSTDDPGPSTRPRRARSKRAASRAAADPKTAERDAADDARADGAAGGGEVATDKRAAGSGGRADAPAARSAPTMESVRRMVLASGGAAAVGLAIVGTGASAAGPWILSAGVIGLVISIHRLGRLGPA